MPSVITGYTILQNKCYQAVQDITQLLQKQTIPTYRSETMKEVNTVVCTTPEVHLCSVTGSNTRPKQVLTQYKTLLKMS